MKNMKKLGIIISVITVLVVVAALAGCLQTQKKQEEIKIGVIAPLTGDAAIYGNALQKGLDLAKDEINTKGGIQGKNISLIYEDSQADPKTAISAFNKLVSVDKVSLIIGDMFSSTTLSVAPLAQKNKIVLFSPTASSEEVPKTGDYVFTIYPSDSYDGKFIADFTLNMIHNKTAAIIYVQADAMIGVKDAFKKSFNDGGGKILTEESYAPKTDDFRSILAKIKPLKPEVIFIPGYLEEIVKLLTQAKEIGIESQFITISTAYDEKLFSLANNSAEGLMLSAPFYDPTSKQPEIFAFQESFKKKYGDTPNVWAAYGYDALNIISYAYNNSMANSMPLNIEISKIRNYPGVTGKTTFLENRTVEKQLRIMIVRNKNFTEY